MTNPSPLAATRLRPEASDTTRYLCAAAYLNHRFSRAVLDEVVSQTHRAVAPSHGISLLPVIQHSFAAQRFKLIRDIAIGAALILGSAVSFRSGLILFLCLVSLWLVVRGVRLLLARRFTSGVKHLAVVALVTGPALLAVAFASLALDYEYWYYNQLSAGSLPLLIDWRSWTVVLLVIWGICFAYRLRLHRTIAVDLSPRDHDPARAPSVPPRLRSRLDYIASAESGNLTVYSPTTQSPFIGFGDVSHRWSLVTPLKPCDDESPTAADVTGPRVARSGQFVDDTVRPFTVDELYDAVRTGFAELADPRLPPDERIPQLSIRDRVFASGRLSPDSSFLENGLPRSRLSESDIKLVQSAERGAVRHFQTVRMVAWRGELEVTIFLHLAVRGGMLYAEFLATVLPGLHWAYVAVDTHERFDTVSVLGAAARGVGDVVMSPLALVNLIGTGVGAVRRTLDSRRGDKRIGRQVMFDYGCRSSVREFATDFADPHPFQLADADQRVGVVARRVLQVLVAFLSQRGYSTADLVGQATTVINNNTRIDNSNTFHNSTLNSSPVAAGTSASAKVRTTSSSPPTPRPAGRQTKGSPQ